MLKQGGYMIQKTHLAFKIESEQSPLRQVNSVGVHLGNGPEQLFYIQVMGIKGTVPVPCTNLFLYFSEIKGLKAPKLFVGITFQ